MSTRRGVRWLSVAVGLLIIASMFSWSGEMLARLDFESFGSVQRIVGAMLRFVSFVMACWIFREMAMGYVERGDDGQV